MKTLKTVLLSVLSTTLLFFTANEIRKERVRQRRITLR